MSSVYPTTITLGPVYNEFSYNEQPASFVCIKIIECSVKGSVKRAPTYNQQFLLYLFTRCKRDPVYIYDTGFQRVRFSKDKNVK